MAKARKAAPHRGASVIPWVGAIVILGSVVGWVARPGQWFAELSAPSWNPPSWVFAPVWTTLYALMGVSGWLIWRVSPRTGAARIALLAFAVQLGLNLLWSPLFFGMHRIDLAMMDISLLWVAVLFMIRRMFPVNRVAALLQVPYLAWITFAAALNLSFWLRNG